MIAARTRDALTTRGAASRLARPRSTSAAAARAAQAPTRRSSAPAAREGQPAASTLPTLPLTPTAAALWLATSAPAAAAEDLLQQSAPAARAAADAASSAAAQQGPVLAQQTLAPPPVGAEPAQAGRGLGRLLQHYEEYGGWVAYGAGVAVTVALLVEAVPLIALSKRLTLRQSLQFSAGTSDATGRLRWVGMTGLTVLPVTCWAAWLLAAWTERDDALRAIYVMYALIYAAPLLQLTGGFERFGPAAGALWLACGLHVQMHRVLRTNRVL